MRKTATVLAGLILSMFATTAQAKPCDSKITEDPNWRNVVAEAALAADAWTAPKEPRALFIGPKGPGEATPTYQVAGKHKNKYLIFLTFTDNSGNTTFASILPKFSLCPIPEDFYKKDKPFEIIQVKFNGRVVK